MCYFCEKPASGHADIDVFGSKMTLYLCKNHIDETLRNMALMDLLKKKFPSA